MWVERFKALKDTKKRIQVLDFTTCCCSMNLPKTYGFLEIICLYNIIWFVYRFLFAVDYNVVI